MNDEHDNREDGDAVPEGPEGDGSGTADEDGAEVSRLVLPPGVTSREGADERLAQQREEADARAAIDAIDDDPTGLPQLRYMPLMPFWSLECTMITPDTPGVVVTLSHAALPNGVPFLLDRDRALKLASQLKKAAQTGPARIEVVKPRLILPGQ